MSKFFKKFKKSVLALFWEIFAQIWGKMNFPRKKDSVQLSIMMKKT